MKQMKTVFWGSLFALSTLAMGSEEEKKDNYAGGDEVIVKGEISPPTDGALVSAPYRDKSLPLDKRVEDLFSRLTEEEKAAFLHGCSGYEYGDMPRIGLARFSMMDAQMGVRLAGENTSTAFSCGLAMAASWNPALLEKAAMVMGEECKATNGRVLLGPGVNIMRTPLGGRTFEYYGEDPVLAGKMAAGFIRGVQSRGVSASLKHWLLNDQEWARTRIDVYASERAIREIYAKPFEIAVKESNPWTIMSSYNRVRGRYASHQREKLNHILYDDWKYDGVLISDWGAWYGDPAASLNGGCYMEMPSGKSEERDKQLVSLVNEGKVKKEYFVDGVKRNIKFALRVGAFTDSLEGRINMPDHQKTALEMAQEGMVLLKNEARFLPLDVKKIRKVAVIGPNADQYHTMADGSVLQLRGGAGAVRPPYEKTPLAGLVELFGKENVLFAPGFRFEASGKKTNVKDKDPGKKTFPDMKEWDPVEAAREADIVVFVGGTDHEYDTEAMGMGIPQAADKPDLNLKGNQVELLEKVLGVNPRTVVVLVNGAPVQMEEWIDRVPAVVEAWYGGMEAGTAVANILSGKVNPSGKLPCTFGKRLNDWKSHSEGFSSYPGDNRWDKEVPVQDYKDGIWVGYRHFDKAGIEPRFPFGFGLSYTTFKIAPATSDLAQGKFSVVVTNTGDREGAEVVQCYLSKPGTQKTKMPVRELVGFQKVLLKPGESKVVTFTLTEEDKRYWDEEENKWAVMPGAHEVFLGNSSRNLPVKYTWK